MVGASGVDGIVAGIIENSADSFPNPTEFLAYTLNLYVTPTANPVWVWVKAVVGIAEAAWT